MMVAVRPAFHACRAAAPKAANIDHISNGRLTLNVVSSWWAGRSAKVWRGVRNSTTTGMRAPANG